MIDPKTDILVRVYGLYVAMVVFALAIIGSILVTQIRDKEELEKYAEMNELKMREETAFRGNVFSNNGS